MINSSSEQGKEAYKAQNEGAANKVEQSPPRPTTKGDNPHHQQMAERMAFLANTRVRSAMVWDVCIPPAINSIKGHFIPKFLHSNRERRISVEIRTPSHASKPEVSTAMTKSKGETANHPSVDTTNTDAEFTVVRIFLPHTSKEAKILLDAANAVSEGVMTTAAFAGKAVTGAVEVTNYVGRKAVELPQAAATAARGIASLSHNNDGGQGDGDKPTRRGSRGDDSEASMSTLGVRGVDDPNKENENDDANKREPDHSTSATSNAEQLSTPNFAFNQVQQAHWIEKYCLPLENIVINKRVKNICVVTTTHVIKNATSAASTSDDLSLMDAGSSLSDTGGSPGALSLIHGRNQDGVIKKNKTREITFQTEADAINFDKLIRNEKKIAAQKTRKKLKNALGDGKIDQNAAIKLLIEITSAWDLPVGDMVSSDPFVIVKMGPHHDREVHRTKHVASTLNPIWTVKTQSLFLLSTSSKDLFRCYDGILFEVKDYDAIGESETLGRVWVPPKVLYEGKGDRMEFPLQVPPALAAKQPKGKRPVLVLRFRHANNEDMNFMADLARTGNGESHWRPKGVKLSVNILQRNSRTENGVIHYRVRPGPDPKRKSETEWMSETQIEEESLKKSTQWLEAGSGHLGLVYVEVIGCTGLPNLDALVGGVSLGNKTDAFACLVFEDCIVQTDVINDCLSPRWMPWSNRAFIFHMMHPSSQLFIGVFDFDMADINNHDGIGRITVDISKFKPKLEYTVHYNLYTSSSNRDRKSNGTITIRVRVECDERQLLLSSIEAVPPNVYINCRRKKDFELARYTVEGEDIRNKYSLGRLGEYAQELQSYQIALFYIKEGLFNVLLWRGHVDVELPYDISQYLKRAYNCIKSLENRVGIKPNAKDQPPVFRKGDKGTILTLPLHSFLAFMIGTTLIERPQFIPSFSMACLGWMMVAIMELRLGNPSPWSRFRPFQDLVWILVYGHPLKGVEAIKPGQNSEKAKQWSEYWNAKISKAEAEARKRQEEMLKLQNELAQQMEDVGDGTNISSQDKGISFDPLKAYLFPIQLQLQWIVDIMRIVRNILIWEEYYFSFWLTAGSFALSVVFLFIPWRFCLTWTIRILSWALLGPWMKLVDIYHFQVIENLDEQGKAQREKQIIATQKTTYDDIVRQARIAKEDAMKIKDMKVFKFGKYIAWVPILKVDRIKDIPLPNSKAEIYEETVTLVEQAMQEAGKNRIRVPGQHLVGSMIPKPVTASVLAAHGQPTLKPVAEVSTSDSTPKAIVKVGSVVVGAAVLTWFAVPLIASFTKSCLS